MPGSAGDSSQRQKEKTLIPVTIKQLLGATSSGDLMLVDNQPIDKIIFIGIVRNIYKQATNTQYTVEDGTGTIEVTQWKDSSQQQNDDQMDIDSADGIELGKYVSIMGSLRHFNNRRSVNANHLRRITDFNEVIYHLLRSLSVHLQATGKGAKQQRIGGETEDDLFVDSGAGNALQNRVFNLLAAYRGDTGVHINDIIRQLNASYNEVAAEVEEMVTAGRIYESDDQCYMAAQ